MRVHFSKLLMFTLLLLFGSCVGTITSKKKLLTKGAVAGVDVINYPGIINAIPISNSKVEVYFPGIQGDQTGEYTYVVMYNSFLSPSNYKSADLVMSKDEKGNLRVIIDKLSIDTYYNFSVQVKDSKGNSSTNLKIVEAKTFSNTTADFYGISTVQNLTGIDGAYGVRVNWIAAKKTGLLGNDPTDVSKYEIKLAEEPLLPSSFEDASADQALIKIKTIESTKITADVTGLKQDTTYYIRVRAIHDVYEANKIDPNYKKEENNVFLKIKTFSLDDVIELNPNSLIASSSAMSGTIDVAWERARGPFLNYRLYYSLDDGNSNAWPSGIINSSCTSIYSVTTGWACKLVDPDKVITTLSDLENFESYNIVLTACKNASCSSREDYSLVKITPSPTMANFGGILAIDSPKAYFELDTVGIRFATPDFSTGIISGLFVKFMGRMNQNPVEPPCILNHPTDPCTETTKYTLSSFDYRTENLVQVRGINPTSTEPYCFKMLPYVEKSDGIQIPNEEIFQEHCIVPSIDLPTVAQFTGISSVIIDGSFIRVEWTPPTGGIFNKYNLWVRKGNNEFNYSNAIAGDPTYVKYEFDYGTPPQGNGNIQFVLGPITDVSPGDYLEFGLLVSKQTETGRAYSPHFIGIKKVLWQ